MKKGKLNAITDVKGVKVGHKTVSRGNHQTGVTVIIPGMHNLFYTKHNAAAHVINGFGKSQGLIQIDELGTLETPIALTNTLNVGLVHDALVEYTLNACQADGLDLPASINPVVMECNDSYLNDIRKRVVGYAEVKEAIESASETFLQGAVGAGRGTVCYGMKGGIGSASRVFDIANETYTMGVLVQSNYGNMRDLQIEGSRIGQKLTDDDECDKGSIIIVMATDLPLNFRQLKRVIKRASVGMARLGSYIGHGSGEMVLGFTTCDMHEKDAPAVRQVRELREDLINIAFRAIGECTEEAIVNSLHYATTVTGNANHTVKCFEEYQSSL